MAEIQSMVGLAALDAAYETPTDARRKEDKETAAKLRAQTGTEEKQAAAVSWMPFPAGRARLKERRESQKKTQM
jgi:hypothetical protein